MSYKAQEQSLLDDDLYREIILEHYARPAHRKKLENPTHWEEGLNPSCGDEVEIALQVKDGVIEDVGFQGHGCSISLASASMLTTLLLGKTVDQARQLCGGFKEWMLDRECSEPSVDIEDLEALEGVRRYPVRIKCALLPWNTFLGALEQGES